MKIGKRPEPHIVSQSLSSDRPSTVSFADTLSNGKSLDAIRKERALGFSEAGLFGTRKGESAGNIAKLQSAKSAQSQHDSLVAKTVSEVSPAQNRNRPATVNTHSPSSAPKIALPRTRENTGKSPVFQGIVGDDNRVSCQRIEPRKLVPLASIASDLFTAKAKKKSLALTLNGEDGAIDILISGTTEAAEMPEQLALLFKNICSQFGVTLVGFRLTNSGTDYKYLVSKGVSQWP